ncbi:MAG: hypothetical protein ACD_5C00358G0003 [uncultured bacterium]|nr:MAG: hypothetical protein ACD_5C00358G0003 [uncultured bacterium]
MWDFSQERKEEKPKGIRVKSIGPDSISIGNLKPEEVERFEGAINDHLWVSAKSGRLEVVAKKKDLPKPTEDEEMLPFWRRQMPGSYQLELFKVAVPKYFSPSIIIQHLCGYNYTPENYKRTAELLEGYGFECLRSRRGNDAKYSEIWLLSGLWSAKGKLKEILQGSDSSSKKNLDKAIEFLCRNVQFGTLDVSFQRAAMTVPD